MAKKKFQSKKHKFKHVEAGLEGASGVPTTQTARTSEVVSAAAQPKIASSARLAALNSARDFSYVGSDLRRIGLFAVTLVALELILWLLFNHTGLGPAVYRLINV